MAETHDPIALELFKNAIFSIADEMALTVFRTTYSGVLKDNMDYSTGFADADEFQSHFQLHPAQSRARYAHRHQRGDIHGVRPPFPRRL